ncbi:MAG: hypothetical protein COV45_08520 [Deltaproteobacteria bacterium CG11_big_fil_rev_8_21_14_0_20_47_16]|nr:MAG: hypothetical protein COV45_08520 [Deltaproteobacteria bacterium CG11_big_fil_rev_8_21_14_0_20_47_16]
MMNKGIILLLLLGISVGAYARAITPWLIDYGSTIAPSQIATVSIAIVDPDNISPSQFKQVSTKLFAYISIGEVNNTRSWWAQVKGASWLVEPNPDWPGAFRVDVRAKAWRQLLMNTLIPKIVSQGFTGIFLDTIDVPLYLEEKNPNLYQGSRAALVDLIKSIHKKFPQLGIIPNNGFPILPDIGNIITGALAEDVYTRYNFATKTYEATPEDDRRIKEDALIAFRKRFKKPAFVVLYGKPGSPLIQDAINLCQKHDFDWYVAGVSLNGIGQVEN